jgi:hypothetical protein
MKNILAENMRRFGTKNLREQDLDPSDFLLGDEPEVVGLTPTPNIYDLDEPTDKLKLYHSPQELAKLIKLDLDRGDGQPMKTKTEKDVTVQNKYYFATKRLGGGDRAVLAYNPKTGEVTSIPESGRGKTLMKLQPNLPEFQVYMQLRDYGIAKRNKKIQKGL